MKTRKTDLGLVQGEYVSGVNPNYHNLVSAEMVDYLEGQLFQKPTISSFSLTGVNSSYEISSSPHSVASFSHKETNTNNIEGDLILKKGSSTIKSGITPSSGDITVDLTNESFTLNSNGSSVTYSLSGTDKRNQAFSKSVTISAYTPSRIGGLTSATITSSQLNNLTKVASASLSGSRTITLNSTGYLYFVTISTISGITSSGFEVPIIKLRDLSTTVNGISVSYKVYRSNQLEAGTYNLVIS